MVGLKPLKITLKTPAGKNWYNPLNKIIPCIHQHLVKSLDHQRYHTLVGPHQLLAIIQSQIFCNTTFTLLQHSPPSSFLVQIQLSASLHTPENNRLEKLFSIVLKGDFFSLVPPLKVLSTEKLTKARLGVSRTVNVD